METAPEYTRFGALRASGLRAGFAVVAVCLAVVVSSCDSRRGGTHDQSGSTHTPTPTFVTPTVVGWSTDTPEANMEPTLDPTIQALLLTPWPTRFISYSQLTATATLLPGPTETESPTETSAP